MAGAEQSVDGHITPSHQGVESGRGALEQGEQREVLNTLFPGFQHS